MASNAGPWALANFADVMELWIERDGPIPRIVMNVGEWVMSRSDDPYEGVRREAGFPNLGERLFPTPVTTGQRCFAFIGSRTPRGLFNARASLRSAFRSSRYGARGCRPTRSIESTYSVR